MSDLERLLLMGCGAVRAGRRAWTRSLTLHSRPWSTRSRLACGLSAPRTWEDCYVKLIGSCPTTMPAEILGMFS
jgi:hypothetical protein